MARGIPATVLEHFKSVPLFSRVTRQGLRSIVSSATEIDVSPGTTLVREGGFDRDLFVIVSGLADVSRGGKRINTLGAGDFFGEISLLHGAPRSATVTARTQMTVLVLGSRELDEIIRREPALVSPMMTAMAERLRATEKPSPRS